LLFEIWIVDASIFVVCCVHRHVWFILAGWLADCVKASLVALLWGVLGGVFFVLVAGWWGGLGWWCV
jgi:hypothetical protein